MHPEAVDTGVLRVAPVGQDPKLHNLVCGHLRGLEVEGLDGLPILVVGKRAQKCPFLLQVFIKALQKRTQGVREAIPSHTVVSALQLQTAMQKGQVSP